MSVTARITAAEIITYLRSLRVGQSLPDIVPELTEALVPVLGNLNGSPLRNESGFGAGQEVALS